MLGGGTNRYYSCPQNKARLVQQSVEGRIVYVRPALVLLALISML